MNKLLFLFFFSPQLFYTQVNDSFLVVCDSVYNNVNEEAEYPGGPFELKKFILKNLEWPGPDVCVGGTIFLKFIVLQNGQVAKVQIEKGVNREMDKMAFDLILKMPNWLPAKKNGIPVCREINLPVYINLDLWLVMWHNNAQLKLRKNSLL